LSSAPRTWRKSARSLAEARMAQSSALLARHIGAFVAHLVGERRASSHTAEAYRRDLTQLAAFLEQRLGHPPKLAEVNKLELRAWLGTLAREHSSSTLARKVASVRSFYAYILRVDPSQDN